MRYLHGYLYIPMYIRVVYYVISLLMARGGCSYFDRSKIAEDP